MKRRDFLATTMTAGLVLGSPSFSRLKAAEHAKQLIELRTYRFQTPEKQGAFAAFLAQTAIPAWNRLGVKPVGVFKVLREDNPELKSDDELLLLHLVIPYESPDGILKANTDLMKDKAFLEAGKAILLAPKSDPAYLRFESTLMLGFDEAPRVMVPTLSPNRVAQLRIYESHSVERGLKKISMFNEGGEIGIFGRCGMTFVFFGQAIAGSKLPNLTYMLSFADKEAMGTAWAAFGKDPGWIKLKDDPEYKDTVSNITNRVLRPVEGSQI